MATKSEEVPILGDGIDENGPIDGSFALNMLMQQKKWQVRKGFGQIGQYSSSFGNPMAATRPGTTDPLTWGYRAHLGSRLIKTNFNHEQIVSAWVSFSHTENLDRNQSLFFIYTITIDDLTTGDRWEEALYPHTAEREGGSSPNYYGQLTDNPNMPFWHGNYETSAIPVVAGMSTTSADRQSWVSALADTEGIMVPFFFEEFRDHLFFGSKNAGAWIYSPAHYRRSEYESNRPKGVNKVYEQEWVEPYSESSLIKQARFVDGLHFEAYSYFDHTVMGSIGTAVRVNSRMVYGSRRQIFISDGGFPCSVMRPNTFSVDSEHEITALAELNNQLYIFTESETYVYRFPQGVGQIVAGGSLSKISDNIGCINGESIAKAEGSLIWVDKNGIYATQGGMNIAPLSDNVDNLFKEMLANPLNSYYPQSGATSATKVQPRSFTKLDKNNLHLCYCPHMQALFVVMPSTNQALCMTNNQWSLWTSESIVNYEGGTSVVEATQNLNNPWFVASSDSLYCVGSTDVQFLDDGSLGPEDVYVSSYYLMKYGRGGAIDRSIQDEDYRIPTGYWQVSATAGTISGQTYLGRPFKIQPGTTLNFHGTVTEAQEIYAIPIEVVPPSVAGGFDRFQLSFTYDNGNWAPIQNPGVGNELSVMIPSERLTFAALTSVTSTAANTITIDMNGTTAGKKIGLIPGRRNKVIYVVMQRTDLTNSLSGMKIQTPANPTLVNGATTYTLGGYTWYRYFLGSNDKRKDDSVAQPVDWAYKSGHIGMNQPVNVKTRGLYVRMLSHGPGAKPDYLVPDWMFGLFNTVAAADRKGWMSQTIDFTANPPALDDSKWAASLNKTIRTRVADSSSVLRNKVFGQAGVTWEGTYLIDDEEVSLIATSDSAKGKCVSYMMFGFIQNRAQALKFDSAVAAVRAGGNRRRIGR